MLNGFSKNKNRSRLFSGKRVIVKNKGFHCLIYEIFLNISNFKKYIFLALILDGKNSIMKIFKIWWKRFTYPLRIVFNFTSFSKKKKVSNNNIKHFCNLKNKKLIFIRTRKGTPSI